MINSIFKSLKLVGLAVALPFIYGCGSGAGVGSLVGFLFGGGGSLSSGEIALLGSGIGETLAGTGAGLATIHQPEPATMVLFGSGLMAMTYFKSKTGRKK